MHCNFDKFNFGLRGLGLIIICDYPLILALNCQTRSVVAKDPCAKTKWLIGRYGKAHAPFYAAKLGPDIQTLTTRKVILSRYFIQKLLMHFGIYDYKLIEFKIEHDIVQLDASRICALQLKIKSPWASNLPIFVFFLSRPKSINLDLKSDNSDPHIHQQQECPSKDCYKNNKLNVIKFFYFLQQKRFLRQQCLFPSRTLTVLPLFANNIGIFGARHSRNIGQRRRQRLNNQLRGQPKLNRIYQKCQPNVQRQRNINRIYRRRQPNAPSINNEETLNRITNLPQQFTNDPLIDQFFNGSSFI